MSRPSKNVDRLLLKAGRELLLETGAANLKVRQVAARAGVNLGMFHYYFKTREHFLTSVFQEIYEDFFKTFVIQSSGTDSPLARLSRALMVMAKFVRDNRPVLLMLLMDCVQGNRQTLRFAKKNLSRHIAIIVELIRECQKKGLVRKAPVPFVLTYLMGAVGMPNLILGVVEKAASVEPLPVPLGAMREAILNDEAVALRVKMALQGLRP